MSYEIHILKKIPYAFWIGIGITFLLLVVQGYEIGTSDSIEFMPYTLTFLDHSLFPSDLFIQYHLHTPFNERYFFALLTYGITGGKEWLIFDFHVMVTIALGTGLAQIASSFIKDKYLVAFVSFLTLIGLSNWNLASSEMYCSIFEGSVVEFALTSWAVWYMLQRNWWAAGILSVISVLFQPQIGANFFLLYTISGLGTYLFEKPRTTNGFILPWLVCVIPIIFYLGFILYGHYLANPPMNHEQYMKIAYEFRLPHHVYPSYFSKWGVLLALIFAPLSLWYFYKRSTLIFTFLLALVIGDLVYFVGIYVNNYWILTTWWMRMDAWNRFFGCIGLIGMVEVFIKQRNVSQYLVIGILSFAIVTGSIYKFSATHYDFLPRRKVDAERDICLKANQLLPSIANCVTPFHFTALPYYGKVSAYVCFKAIPKRADYLYTWYSRLNEVYKIDTNQIEKGFSLVPIANENFRKLDLKELEHLKGEGVTHIITYASVNYPTLKWIAKNNEFVIYEIGNSKETRH